MSIFDSMFAAVAAPVLNYWHGETGNYYAAGSDKAQPLTVVVRHDNTDVDKMNRKEAEREEIWVLVTDTSVTIARGDRYTRPATVDADTRPFVCNGKKRNLADGRGEYQFVRTQLQVQGPTRRG